jgi:hypothetical protein
VIFVADNINDEEQQKPIRKSWTMLKKANIIPTHTAGMEACWDGFDPLQNYKWIDKINGYTFTCVSSKTAPIHEGNLLNFNAHGGMRSNFSTPATTEVPYSIEIVTRNLKNSITYLSNDWGVVIHPGLNYSWKEITPGITLRKVQNKKPYTFFRAVNNGASGYGVTIPIADLEDNGLDTWTWIPTKGLYRNGICLLEFENRKDIGSFNLSLGIPSHTHSNNDYYRLKFKTHEVRYYP